MASALLASRNELYWGERKVYMRKTPNSNPNPKLCPNSNLNPNSHHQIAIDHASNNQNQFHAMESDEPTASAAAGVAASDDSSSFNRKPVGFGRLRDSDGYATFNISAYSKRELGELKRRLVLELDHVRSVASRIESREFQSSARSVGYSISGVYGGCREVNSSAARPSLAGSETLIDSSAPKTNQFYQPPDLKKRPAATEAAAPELKKLLSGIMNKCGQILTKLMKKKGAKWFNTPVDVVGMGLHDYHLVIKNPMDLGTVKSKLNNGVFQSPLDFASDIRLTFNNALQYNPPGHEVHKLADQLLRHFEDLFGPAFANYEKQRSGSTIVTHEAEVVEVRQRVSSWSRPAPVPKTAIRADALPTVSPPPVQTPVQPKPPAPKSPSQPGQPHPQISQLQLQLPPQPVMGRTMMMVGKQPKPKAKDPNKRAMSLEEKENLSSALQNLPQEKMTQVLQIIRRRNVETSQDGDEIELDFELMDNETLWELDRFVCNWKKMMNKMRRQGAINGHGHPISDPSSAHVPQPLLHFEADDKSQMAIAGETPEAVEAKKSKKLEPIDEDVDIGDEMLVTNYPSVEIQKYAGYDSSSSSSGTDSSSSSGSDSGSSSGSDSNADDDDARSPALGSRHSISPRSQHHHHVVR